MTKECCRCSRTVWTYRCDSCGYWYCASCASPNDNLVKCSDCGAHVCGIDYFPEFGICIDCYEEKYPIKTTTPLKPTRNHQASVFH